MNRKDSIIIIFQKLVPYWPEVEQYLPLIEISNDDELQKIFKILQEQLENIHDEKLQKKIGNTIKYLQKLYKVEKANKEQESFELNKLLNRILNGEF